MLAVYLQVMNVRANPDLLLGQRKLMGIVGQIPTPFRWATIL